MEHNLPLIRYYKVRSKVLQRCKDVFVIRSLNPNDMTHTVLIIKNGEIIGHHVGTIEQCCDALEDYL